jgi:hypothetical protein
MSAARIAVPAPGQGSTSLPIAARPAALVKPLGGPTTRHALGTTTRVSASEDEGAAPPLQGAEASTSAAVPPRVRSDLPPGRAPPPRPAPPQGMKLQRVERLDKEAWAGVAQVDRGEGDNPTDWARVALLAGGDALALLLFASIGRANHAEGLTLAGVLSTAAPFLAGWFAAAPALGGYGRAAQGGDAGAAALAAAKAWAVAAPAGLLVRTLSKGYLPDKAFVIVSLAATAVLLVGWRTALAAAAPGAPAAAEAAAAGQAGQAPPRRRNKQGNPLEFVGLLLSLVKRW